MNLPAPFLKNLRDIHDDADVWLKALPETLTRLETTWQICVTGVVPRLSYNLVTYAERTDGTRCILKLSPPNDEIVLEGDALRLYGGDGICRLLERDDSVSALLLERVTPGVSLQELWTPERDEAHTRASAELLRRLWRRVAEPHSFRPLRSWARALWNDAGAEISARQQAQARKLLELLSTAYPVLLHADVHHGNVLTSDAAGEPYRAIDPKGIVGPPGYDVGSFLLNPVQANADELAALLPKRLEIFRETLGLSRDELVKWGFVHAVLSACWTLEDHGGGHERALGVARNLEGYL